ncbi:MAG: AAA family ATPase, partial [Actinobacteria bacterium]|nr:AAA family ATPase [Actinomycetota bacterium]
MNNRIFLERLNLENFRCFDQLSIGPFQKFNLIYGRNGSGKTSLVEAVEIALSGHSSRIQGPSNIKEVVARLPAAPVKIGIIRGEEEIYSFDSSRRRSFVPTTALFNLFGISATGPRAKTLLPDLLETHSLLYAERIVQFLEADKRDKLHQVLNESVAGRTAMEQWGRIEAAKLVIARKLRERQKEKEDASKRIEELEEQLEVLKLGDEDDLEAKWKEVYADSPLIIRFFPENITYDESTHPSLPLLIHIETHVRDTKILCDEISAELKTHEEGKFNSLGDVSSEYARIQESIKNTKNKVDKEEKAIQDLQGKIAAKEALIRKTSVEIESKNNSLNKLSSFEQTVKTIMDWLPEILASKRTANLEKGLIKTEEKIRNLEAAAEKMDTLPSVESIRAAIQHLDSTNKAFLTTKETSANNEQAQRSKEAQLKEVEISLTQHRTRSEMAKKTFLELHGRIDEYLELIATNQCPSCGTVFDSPVELRSAIEALRNATEDIEELPWLRVTMDKKLLLERELSTIINTGKALARKIAELDLECKSTAKNISLFEKLIEECKVAFRLAGFEIPEYGKDFLSERVEKLSHISVKALIDEMRKQRLHLLEEIGGVWKELRRDEYRTTRYVLEELIATVPETCQKQDFHPPKELKMESYTSLFENVKGQQESIIKDIGTLENAVKELQKEVVQLNQEVAGHKQQLEECERVIRRLNVSLEKIALLRSKVERVCQTGLFKENETFKTAPAIKELAGILVALETLKQNMIQRDENNKLQVHIKKEYTHLKEKKGNLKGDITKLDAFRQKLGKIQSPQEYTAGTLKQHEKLINKFFQNLHWPRDFDDVAFDLGKDFEIKVSNISTGERRPAHQQLSADENSCGRGRRRSFRDRDFVLSVAAPRQ